MNPLQMVQQFLQFKQNFTGDPQKEVTRLVQSGQISQTQLNDLQRQATQLQQIMQNMRL